MKNEKTRTLSRKAEEIQNSIDELVWAGQALKAIPNLPKGKLRDQLSKDVQSIIDGDETSSERRLAFLNDYISTLVELRRKIATIVAMKRVSPEAIQDLGVFIHQLPDDQAFHYKYNNL